MIHSFYKAIIGLFLISRAIPVLAVTINIEDPCTGQLAATSDQSGKDSVSLGQLTINALEELELSYVGSDAGISSIFNTPTSLDAMEVISDTDMKAYGWCYLVDGELVDRYPNEMASIGVKSVTWFYGYALMEDASWVSMCEKIRYDAKNEGPFFCPLESAF